MALKLIGLLLCPVIIYILLLVISALLVDTSREYTRDSKYYRWLLNSATGLMMIILRIRVRVTGMEKLPEGRFLLVSNHRSNFDPILAWYIFRRQNISYVSKKENFNIPIFGRIIRRCCFMAIDRENPRNAIKTINNAAALITADEASVGIYPEGTRSKECTLLPFHAGVFKIAQKAKVPVVVMTITGTENIHKNRPFRKTDVSIDVLGVIPAAELEGVKSEKISDAVRDCMLEKLKK